jgi:hypothetical protein
MNEGRTGGRSPTKATGFAMDGSWRMQAINLFKGQVT